VGLMYLLHFQRSYHHARHYLGYTENLEARLEAHRAGRGSPLVAAAVRDGTDFALAATWEGDRHEERRLHRYRNSPRQLCPICRGEPTAHAPALALAGGDAGDQALVDGLTELTEPVTLAALQAHLRRQGLSAIGSAHSRLELLALAGRVRKGQVLGEIAWQAQAA
jgi:predicted GIY-YIG superfamily endonuclease